MKTETLKKAIEKFGAINQMDMAIEELAELIQAINKVKRVGLVKKNQIQRKTSTFEEIKTYTNMCSEIADVKIMIAQLEMMLDKETINISIERKMIRLAKKLQ